MKKYCIFDLDGTLIDSMGEWANAMLKILDDENIPYPDNIIEIITPLGNTKTSVLFSEMGVSGTPDEIVERMGEYAIDAYENRILAKPYIPELLRKLKDEGHILAVLTASPHITTDPCLKRNGIFDLFEEVWSVNDFGLTKSQPEIYFEAAKKLGADISEITFFDDNIIALETAKKAGLECVGVYDVSSYGATEKIKALVDTYIVSAKELL